MTKGLDWDKSVIPSGIPAEGGDPGFFAVEPEMVPRVFHFDTARRAGLTMANLRTLCHCLIESTYLILFKSWMESYRTGFNICICHYKAEYCQQAWHLPGPASIPSLNAHNQTWASMNRFSLNLLVTA